MKEPSKPFVLERIKDLLDMMDIKPSATNALIAYNTLLEHFGDGDYEIEKSGAIQK